MKKLKLIALVALFLSTGTSFAQTTKKKTVLFTNVMVFDGTADKLLKRDVLVEGNLIVKVSEEPLTIIASENATIIDGGGNTLMPGLIDSHTHMNVMEPGGLKEWEASTWERIGALATATSLDMFYEGFTTIRDMGGMSTA